MRYEEVRDYIATGDLIAVRRKDGFLSPFTRFFTRSDYTHTGIAVWIDRGLWLAELNGGGNHLIPLSQLETVPFDVYSSPVPEKSVESAIFNRLRVKVDYSIPALFVIGLLNWLRIRVFLHARQILVCSGYCIEVYEDAGWPERSRLQSPVELTRMLNLKFRVEPTV